MLRFRGVLPWFGAVLLIAVFQPSNVAPAADKDAEKQEGKVAGILIEKKNNWVLVKADGDEEPVKYLINDADKRLVAGLKTIYDASRVQLTYKKDGESRQLIAIRKQVLRNTGTVTGVVVKVYNDFWVEVKPKNGPPDAYAPGGTNFNNKAFMDRLKDLQPGDSVTIKFTTDPERHRITTLRKN